jgi:uncharacterized protein
MMDRRDFAFPFRIDGASRQGAEAPSYEAHVEQMIRQVLFTSPGERVNLPDFGCGLRRLLFAPNAEPLAARTKIMVFQALTRWLGAYIEVRSVDVRGGEEPVNENQLLVRIEYVLRETRTLKGLEVAVR